MPSPDVVIAGARCAGAATALLLARAGVRVVVLERGAYGTDTLSTHALMRGAVLQLHRWGLLPEIVAAGTPAVRETTFFYPSGSVRIPIDARHGVDALFAPRRVLLDRVLVDAARAAGAEVLYGAHVEEVQRDNRGGVRGVSATIDGARREIRADLVIGADGLRSSVAAGVGAATHVTGTHAAGLLYSYWQDVPADGYEWQFSDRSMAAVIPTNAATLISLSVPGPDFSAAVRGGATSAYERLLAQFPALAARAAAGRRVEPVRGFPGHPGYLRQSAGRGWALVGDAAYFKDPITAHGITDALRDAELLARAVLAGSSEAFAAYQQTRDDLSHDLFEVTDAIASFAWSEDELRALHRAFSKAMTGELRTLAALETACPSLSASAPLAR